MKNNKLPSDKVIHPLWDSFTAPQFLQRTETPYCKIPLTALNERGIKNALFDSIVNALPEGAYIVGGFVLHLFNGSSDAKDIDIAFTSEQAFRETVNLFTEPPPPPISDSKDVDVCWGLRGYECDQDLKEFVKDSQGIRFLTFSHPEKPKIQLLKLAWYESPEHIIDSFDFTVTQFACDREWIYTNPLSVIDLSRKRLVLHRMQFPASTMRRIIKYTQKGFYICPGSLIEICDKIQKHQGDKDIDQSQFVYLD